MYFDVTRHSVSLYLVLNTLVAFSEVLGQNMQVAFDLTAYVFNQSELCSASFYCMEYRFFGRILI